MPEEELPVMLPTDVERPQGISPFHCEEFVNTTCPQCGDPPGGKPIPWIPSLTHPGISCYTDPHNNELPFAKEKADARCRWTSISAE